MKIYSTPMSSSRAVQIVANEIGVDVELVNVDLKRQMFGEGSDYTAINPNAYLPALQLDDGSILLETPVILQYLADLRPEAHIAPGAGTMERVRADELLSFIATELHQKYFVVFREYVSPEAREQFVKLLLRAFSSLESRLADGRLYMGGDAFATPDAYLWVMLTWAQLLGIDLSSLTRLQAYRERIEARESVKRAIEDEQRMASIRAA
ncbi:glutathione S-transferase N-terminal domain-containing protein [Pseudomonas gingeri]|uniref:glutathione S-transferase N-terminal domain-containing protein n=1 Tax=Pseudomonas gingeri TaxID=117681 RepID=UPI0015A0ECEF|nr:glutathione S-transferase N-terminal domain-containing protein [Pseudomonas gingeri]